MKSKYIEIKKNIVAIDEIISELEKTEENFDESGLDFVYIENTAKNRPFRGHFLKDEEEDIIFAYCSLLASFVQYAKDDEKKIKQYYFIDRIVQSTKYKKNLTDIITASHIIGMDDFDKLATSLSENRIVFFFDALLMIMIDGSIDDEQMSFFNEIVCLIGITKDELISVTKLVKSVLMQDIETIYENAKYYPVHYLSPYFDEVIDKVIINIQEAIDTKEESITVYGITLGNNNEVIDLDTWLAKNITFRNCSFRNVVGMYSKQGNKKFIQCKFEGCKNIEYETYAEENNSAVLCFADNESQLIHGIFNFANATFIECRFDGCGHASEKPICNILEIKNGKICDCVFNDCHVYSPLVFESSLFCVGAIVFCENAIVNACIFNNCKAHGRGKKSWSSGADISYMAIVRNSYGNVDNCEFTDCMARNHWCENLTNQKNNFIVSSVNLTFSNNKFENCEAAKNEGCANLKIK